MKNASEILSETLNERKAVNPAYSLRSFARDLGITPGQLSHVIQGYRGLGPKTAELVCKQLGLDAQTKEYFTESLKAKFSPSKTQRTISQAKLGELSSSQHLTTRNLEIDLFKTIAQWHHFTLLELIKISAKRKNLIPWFSAKLGISENEVRVSLDRLERLELISKTTTGYEANQDSIIAEQGVPAEAVRRFHQQILEKAVVALAFQTKEERYGISASMPIKVKNLPRAKKLLQKFRTDFAKEVSDHQDGEEIYGLSLQFFRLTQTPNQTNSDEKGK